MRRMDVGQRGTFGVYVEEEVQGVDGGSECLCIIIDARRGIKSYVNSSNGIWFRSDRVSEFENEFYSLVLSTKC